MKLAGSFRMQSMLQRDSPVAFAATRLLGASWIDAGMAGFCKVAREVLFRSGCAIGEPNVVPIVLLGGSGHWIEVSVMFNSLIEAPLRSLYDCESTSAGGCAWTAKDGTACLLLVDDERSR